jgi:uncharacterized membrane protein
MNWEPFLSAPFLYQAHAAAAIAALLLGAVQFTLPKGNSRHRLMGWTWVALMYVVSVSSLFIHEIRLWGPFSPIHLLSLLTIFGLPFGVLAARRGDIRRHRNYMMQLYFFGLIVAGTFAAFSPGRMLYRMVVDG